MAERPQPNAQAPDPLSGRALGPYLVGTRLGGGGMGAVYEAFDSKLHRPVAVKILAPHLAADAEASKRFLAEARAAARLNHPNVVHVYDAGQADGVTFLVMELVEGGSVHDLVVRKGPPGWRVATRIAADVCRGLAAAHDAGLVHRDIKPGNLMLAPDGTAKVADFGLAKRLDGAGTAITAAGAIMGTPDYMSPEQCQAERADGRSDLYSLGAAYYFLLTGRPPFRAESAVQVMFAHCSSPAPDPRTIAPDVPAGCAAVAARALAKKRGGRYPDARAMLRDLEALLAAPPSDTHAPAPGPTPTPGPAGQETLSPPPTRRRWLWAAAGVGAAALGAAGLWALRRPTLRTGPFALRQRAVLKGHEAEIRTARFSPDGTMLATAGMERHVIVWWVPSGERRWKLEGRAERAYCAAFAPDGLTLATGGERDPISFWSLEDGGLLESSRGASAIFDLAFSPDGQHLAAGAAYAGVIVWRRDRRTGLAESERRELEEQTRWVGFSPEGKLAAVVWQKSLRLFDGAGLREAGRLPGPVNCAAFGRGGRLAAGTEGGLMLWTPPAQAERVGRAGKTWPVAFSPDGGTVAYADDRPRLLHLASGAEWAAPLAEENLRWLEFAPDGRTLVSAGAGGSVRLWDVLDA